MRVTENAGRVIATIEPKLRLSRGFVEAMARKTMIGQDGQNIAIKANRLSRSAGDRADKPKNYCAASEEHAHIVTPGEPTRSNCACSFNDKPKA